MGKYFVVNIQNTGTSTPCETKGYDTLEQAKSAYHSVLSSNYANPNLKNFGVVILDEIGISVMNEYKSI